MSSVAATVTTATPSLNDQPVSRHDKLGAHQWFESIGSPKYVVAPMVDQSELAWRILSRLHGATIAYTPMFHAALFSSPEHPRYFAESFDTSAESLEGVAPYDRPLIVQFCANEKTTWLAAAEKVVGRCDAVDLNLGCPQGIAKKGGYGAFLMEEWELIGGMISHLHTNLSIPISVKLRIFPSLSRTLEYATHLFKSGAQLLTVHGRTRESKGSLAGLASWPMISSIANLLGPTVPIYANGGIPSGEDVEPCLQETGTKGVMSAEGNLYNPMIFSPSNYLEGRAYGECLPETMRNALKECEKGLLSSPPTTSSSTVASTSTLPGPAYAPATYIAAQYLAIVVTLPSTETSPSAVKSHLFKLMRPIWATGKHLDLREALGKALGGRGTRAQRCERYCGVIREMEERIKNDLATGELPPNSHRLLTHAEVMEEFDGVVPYSHCQPYYRIQRVLSSAEQEPNLVERVAEAKRSREGSPVVTEAVITTQFDITTASVISSTSSSKRQKLSPPSPPVAASDVTAESNPSRPPNTSTSACTGMSLDGLRACKNVPNTKCPITACRSCCGILYPAYSLSQRRLVDSAVGELQDEKEGERMCEAHLAREAKDREKAEIKKERRVESKERNKIERGKKKAKAREEKVAALEVVAEVAVL